MRKKNYQILDVITTQINNRNGNSSRYCWRFSILNTIIASSQWMILHTHTHVLHNALIIFFISHWLYKWWWWWKQWWLTYWKDWRKIHLLKRNWKGKKMITMTNWWWLLKIKCISDSWEKLKDNDDDDNNLIYIWVTKRGKKHSMKNSREKISHKHK